MWGIAVVSWTRIFEVFQQSIEKNIIKSLSKQKSRDTLLPKSLRTIIGIATASRKSGMVQAVCWHACALASVMAIELYIYMYIFVVKIQVKCNFDCFCIALQRMVLS